jgi:hypothetical protein
MTPRPIYRWKSFWLGILILGFLGWAWARSMSWESYLNWGTETNGAWVFTSGTGEVLLGWLGHGLEPTFMLGLVHEQFEVYPPGEASWFPRFAEVYSEPPFSRGIKVAHWFLMLVFLVTWLGWLFWRVRKHGRNTA